MDKNEVEFWIKVCWWAGNLLAVSWLGLWGYGYLDWWWERRKLRKAREKGGAHG